ncbi:hypothetical protein OG429_39455 [Streptomyces sp. NBC_00190]|uniref:hypothetical protein n=1 Tax=unclassified Streptomyces TaxID=2593676 RepID=UPI002E2BAB60|nr:hypothetical protein [Streptomyces sp. NBC_00190]WSZ37639.1 hypothetical protein OG239_01360 [Streptomyces sp. NBC_00868]
MNKKNASILAVSMAAAIALLVPESAYAWSMGFQVSPKAAGIRAGFASGRLVTGGATRADCSYAKIKEGTGRVMDTDTDGHSVVAWLVWNDCTTGTERWKKIGAAIKYGDDAPLSTEPAYNAKNAKVYACLAFGDNQKIDCGTYW